MNHPTDVSVVILTFNEEKNLPFALASIGVWAKQVFVLDSESSDRTVEIARGAGAVVERRKFDNYANQRNHALKVFQIATEWVLFLDADEWVTPELKQEIADRIAANPAENGFYLRRRTYFMGRWMRHGYYPVWILRLFRSGKAKCEARTVNEHLIVDGDVGYLDNDFVDENRKGLSDWISKHNRYASMEADELLRGQVDDAQIGGDLFGPQAQRKRWIRTHVWNRLPAGMRPFFLFGYRYLLRGGILDGKEAFYFHFFQSLWFHLLIDAKSSEAKKSNSEGKPSELL